MGRVEFYRKVHQILAGFLVLIIMVPAAGFSQAVITASNQQEGALFGRAVLGLSDIDGNGAGEYLVSAPYEDVGIWTRTGRVYHIDGSGQDTIKTMTNPNQDFTTFFGIDMEYTGDINSNGSDDIIISASGAEMWGNTTQRGGAYVYDGGTFDSLLAVRPPANMETTMLGTSVSGIGDVNGDDVSDLVLVDSQSRENSWANKFVVFIYSGVDNDGDGYADFLHTIDEPVNAEYPYYDIGGEIAGGTDLTGDGSGDLLIGNPVNEFVHIVNGADGGIHRTVVTPFAGGNVNQFNGHFGTSVSFITDVSGDSVPEFIVGAPDEYGERSGGKVYVYNGATLDAMHEIYSPIDGTPSEFGNAVQAIPDINDDDQADFLVGSTANAPDGTVSAGRVYVFSTSDFSFVAELVSPTPQNFSSYYDNFGVELTGVPDANSDGRAEILVGAPNDSTQSGVSQMGVAYQFSSQGFPGFNLPPNADFTADTTQALTTDTLTFTANASDPDGSVIGYRWDFQSDGTVDDTSQSPKHRFYNSGKYKVSLTVVDDDSVTASHSALITIFPGEKDTGPRRLTDNSVDDTNPFIIGPSTVYYHSDMNNEVIRKNTNDYSLQSNAQHLNADQNNVVYVANTVNGNAGIFLYNGRVTPDELGHVYYYPSRGAIEPFNDKVGGKGLIAYSHAEGTSNFTLGFYANGHNYTDMGMGLNPMFPRVSTDGYTIAYAAKENASGDPYEIYRYTWSDSVNGGTNERIAKAASENENLGMENEVTPLGIAISDSGEVIAWEAKTSTSTGASRHIEYWKNGVVHEVTGQGWPVVSHDGRYIMTHDYIYDTQQEKGLDIGGSDYGDLDASTNYPRTFDMDYDGNYVVFTGELDQKLYIHSRITNRTQLVRDSDDDMRTPRISPDGMYLAWEEKVNGDDWEIFTYRNPMSEGGLENPGTNISELPDQRVANLQISADGRYSVFTGMLGFSPEVYLYDKEVGARQVLTDNAVGESNLLLSGDGSVLLWSQTDVQGNNAQTVYFDIEQTNRAVLADMATPEAISHDGSRVLLDFAYNGKIYRGRTVLYDKSTGLYNPIPDIGDLEDYSPDLNYLLLEESDSLKVYNTQDSSLVEFAAGYSVEGYPEIDSSGTRVLYQTEVDSTEMEQLRLYDTTTDSTIIISENSTEDDMWIEFGALTGDGSTVFFQVSAEGNVEGNNVIYRYDISTGQQVMVDDQGIDEYLDDYDYSEDGRFFAYSKIINEEQWVKDVFYYDHKTGTTTGVTHDNANDQNPVISADGTTLLWAGKDGAGPQATTEAWQYQLYEPTTTPVADGADVPENFRLYSNYPNPFNPETTFQFALPGASNVQIQIFNIRGQQVRVMQLGRMTAGTKMVQFDGSDLASGMYVYRVVVKSADRTLRKTGKFTLLK
ncbi:MAG: T9SS type A sorting domain-containing protein [Candidatus Marinimicrobia bacterium]|nr:T9SS type A sorting domain-containing protein [Candidatus Neomarinimicrobiota bacterium]MCF7829500.1 T9SS type A sorting domain-containing protein [Candidatus Neomarinimicrobiota bacterium]MCF7880102.1 T9SS type A sorting domain-containing protein [Candidatus Neomarinimicrobiota bacterium]